MRKTQNAILLLSRRGSAINLSGGYGVRIDSMVSAGDSILPYYDSMVAKLIVWGKDRDDAIREAKELYGNSKSKELNRL